MAATRGLLCKENVGCSDFGQPTGLKVPKRENFLLAFFALSEPIWVGDLGTKQKQIFF